MNAYVEVSQNFRGKTAGMKRKNVSRGTKYICLSIAEEADAATLFPYHQTVGGIRLTVGSAFVKTLHFAPFCAFTHKEAISLLYYAILF